MMLHVLRIVFLLENVFIYFFFEGIFVKMYTMIEMATMTIKMPSIPNPINLKEEIKSV